MGIIILPEGCIEKQLNVKEAVNKIQKYWTDNPEYKFYDSKIIIADDSIYDAIAKAQILLRREIDSDKRNMLHDWVRENESTIQELEIVNVFIQGKNDLPGIGKAILTKTLHRLNPKTIPIVDSVIFDFYKEKIGSCLYDICCTIKEGCKNNIPALEIVCREVNDKDFTITPLRAWDILVWSSLPPKNKKQGK